MSVPSYDAVVTSSHAGVQGTDPIVCDGALAPLHPIFQDFFAHLSTSSLFSALMCARGDVAPYTLAFMRSDGSDVIVDDVARVVYVADEGLSAAAIIRSPFFMHRLLVYILCALRAIDHGMRATLPPFLNPRDMLVAHRVMRADQVATALMIAHDLRDTLPLLWRHILASDLQDLAAILHDERIHGDHHTQHAVFEGWFADPARVHVADFQALEHLDTQFRFGIDPRGFRARLTRDVMRHICVGDNGKTYLPSSLRIPHLDGVDPIHAAFLHQLEREQEMVLVNNVGFRDEILARRIFDQ